MLPMPTSVFNGTGLSTIQDALIIPCTIDARWLRAKIKYEPTTSDSINDDTTNSATLSEFQILIKRVQRELGDKRGLVPGDIIALTSTLAGPPA